MAGRLEGKVAIITGAGSVAPGWGNGRAAAVIFAREGAKVFAVDLKPDAMEETVARARETGGEITTHACDATRSDQVAAKVAACVAAFGRVDVLVNNIGGSSPGGAVTLTEEAWHRQIDFDLTSVFLSCKYVIPEMQWGVAARSSTPPPRRVCATSGRLTSPTLRQRLRSSSSRG